MRGRWVARGRGRRRRALNRSATRLAPDSATAQLALGAAAEALGEFDEALSAYQAAARRAPSTTTWLRLAEMADRIGVSACPWPALSQSA
ncbi:MAG: hypothetical protein DME01_19700 [Candidatus Rokuibacteriota bacterium]|nr:MAG: hypothetical protein DME01_19700 [Candidatus Rokubacteria bacterium]